MIVELAKHCPETGLSRKLVQHKFYYLVRFKYVL